MKYPRLYSISTVGILKHYNQDYLLNSIRTDFTGNNGVGKSIIADLFQIIFIAQRSKIVFGTEGLKKKERLIHSLPHECSEAYAFLNVEVEKDIFIVMGVCIPNTASKRLKSFLILTQNDLNKEIKETGIPKSKLVTHRHFLTGNRIPLIEDLAIHLRDKYELQLNYYSTRSEKTEYFNFLFNKKILSINLSIEDNLNAFAKIIQSFSRARSLDVDDSDSLKQFLFEDTKKVHEEIFQSHKIDLERLLADYRLLDKFIKELDSKQKALSELKTKEQDKIEKERVHMESEVRFCYLEMENLILEADKLNVKVRQVQQRKDVLTKRIPKLAGLISRANSVWEESKRDQDNLAKYHKEHSEYLKALGMYMQLKELDCPVVKEKNIQKIEPDRYSISEMVRRVTDFKPLYLKYGSLEAMERTFKEQNDALSRHKQELLNKITSLQHVLEIISLDKSDSFISKMISRKEVLTAQQEQVLFSLIDLLYGKPNDFKSGTRYTETLEILDEANFTSDQAKKGFWFKNGDTHTFYNNDIEKKRLFENVANLRKALKDKVTEIKSEMDVLVTESVEIEKFLSGKGYRVDLITLNLVLDQQLKDYSALNTFKEAAGITLVVKGKLSDLEEDLKNRENVLSSFSKVTSMNQAEDLFTLLADVNTKVNQNSARLRSLSETRASEETESSSLDNSLVALKSQIDQNLIAYNSAKTDYIEKDERFKATFAGIVIDHSGRDRISRKTLEEAERKFAIARENFVTDYKAIVNRYDETKDRTNPDVNEQLDQSTYQFSILEHVLLGPRIKHLDAIGEKLRESNESRLSMAETIHETMLKIFSLTKTKYGNYAKVVRDLNTFFKGKKISNKYYFRIHFTPLKDFNIEWITKLQSSSQRVSRKGELPFGDTVEQFVEDFFKSVTGYKKRIYLSDLLDPRTYFQLSVSLTDENNKDIPGSTGETYSAIVLLAIGRLSIVQDTAREGIKFIILEETANLDKINFNTFPNLAEEFGYQILTMTPKPYGSDSEKGWYLHHLLPGVNESEINYPDVASYFKTNEATTDLSTYLEALDKI